MSTLFVVGLGPGSAAGMTEAAHAALTNADVLCGYTTYIDLVAPLFPNKEFLSTAMRSETERCRLALTLAQTKPVAMVCSGDPGVYGMAGLLYELLNEYPGVELVVIPGVTAALSGAALLGAPLMQDFAVVSLSDLLVSWDVIERRLQGAATGDFVTVLYNPGSHRRRDHLRRACNIFLASRSGDTPCGLVRHIDRDGETSELLTLGALADTEVDMFTTVFIGNSRTRVQNGKLITLRGYEVKR